MLWFVLSDFPTFATEVTDTGQCVSSFKQEAKSAIKTLSLSLIEPLSKSDAGLAQGMSKAMGEISRQILLDLQKALKSR